MKRLRTGLFRGWIALSALWILLTGTMAYSILSSLVAHPNPEYPVLDQLWRLSLIITAPIFVLFIIGLGVTWIVSGFRG